MSEPLSNASAPPEGTLRKVERHNPEQPTPLYYVNNAQLKTSLWDIVMDFGILLDVTEDSIVIQNQVTLVMSPQHAIAFARVLHDNIEKYEEQFGKINVPSGVAGTK